MAAFNTLNLPPKAVEQGGDEFVRAAISNGELFMSLKRAFDDPEAWGRILAEMVKQVSHIYATETQYNKADAAKRIVEAFAKDMAADGPQIAKQ